MTKEAAEQALRHGADAVWVSNHGGRQLDTLPATIEALPEVNIVPFMFREVVKVWDHIRLNTSAVRILKNADFRHFKRSSLHF